MIVVAVLWVLAIAGLLWRSVRQYAAYEVLDAQMLPDATLPSIHVVVPARNEAANIGPCVSGLLAQAYPPDRLRITVVDDASGDDTPVVVERLAQSDGRLRLLSAGALPPGWTGKAHACWRGAQENAAEWLCFIDADTVASPRLLSAAITHAETRKLGLLSLEPRQDLLTFWERVVIPAGLLLISFIVDLHRVNRDTGDIAIDGQFILIRARIYTDIGGHRRVRAAIVEDKALGEIVRGNGHTIQLMSAGGLLRVRMYSGLAGLWEGLSKNAVDVVGSRGRTVLIAVGAVVLGWGVPILPVACWATDTPLAAAIALLGSVTLVGTHLATARYFRVPLWFGLTLPLGFTMLAAIAARCLWAEHKGVVAWKGRVYSVPPRYRVRRE